MIKFRKVRDVKDPIRDGLNAGFDFFVPTFTDDFIKEFYNLNKKYILTQDCATMETLGYVSVEAEREILDSFRTHGFTLSIGNGTHWNIKIPSGIEYKLEDTVSNYTTRKLEIQNKSGIASKYSIIVGACVCDMEYRDEVIFNLIGFDTFTLKEGLKIVQGVVSVIDIPPMEVFQLGTPSLFSEEMNNRGGGFGSTGEH